MERVPTPKLDGDTETVINQIFDGAFGNPIAFKSIPISSDLKPNQWGFYGTKIYIKFSDGTAISLTGAAL